MRESWARLIDILIAMEAIDGHLTRGDLQDDLIFDAVRVRLIEIGEAVKGIEPRMLALEANVPWQDIARMRDHLAHRYFDTDHTIVAATIERDLPALIDAVKRLKDVIDSGEQ